MARGTIIGFMIAIILVGFVVAVLDFRKPGEGDTEPAAKVTVVRLGPGGRPGAFFGDDVENTIIPGSQAYDFCFGEIRVQRPSMITTDMPTAFCTVTRSADRGPWRISTGGWQECQAACIKLAGE